MPRTVLKLREVASTWEEALESFVRHKASEGLRPATITDYRAKIGQFFRLHPEAWPDDLEAPLQGWLAEARNASTYNLRLSNLRLFLDWAVGRGLVINNPLAGLHQRRKGDRIVEVPPETLKRLVALPDRSKYVGLRDYALLLLQLDTGIRPAEAFGLVPGDIDLTGNVVRVRAEVAKIGVARSLPISSKTSSALADFLSNRSPEWPKNAPVFTSAYGRPLDKDVWGDILEAYGKRLGYHLYPYALRHTFAIQFLRRGGNAFALQALMGHNSMDMTKRYVHLVATDVEAAHKIASPVAGLLPGGRRRRLRAIK